ncbi:plasma-membrane choline transporter family protein [Wolffia australiana]
MRNNDFASASSDTDLGSTYSVEETAQHSQIHNNGAISLPPVHLARRHWRDVFWLAVFSLHLLGLAFVLSILGLNRYGTPDRIKIDRFTSQHGVNSAELTETYWPLYGVAGGVGIVLGWTWLLLLGSCASQMLKISVHFLTTYLSILSVLCFWKEHIFWGIAFAVGAALQFMYVMSVVDRLPFTMLVLQKAIKTVWNLPQVMRVPYGFMFIMLSWMTIWSFGVSGVIASNIGYQGRWWLLVVFSVSLFWTGAVLCNTVHVVVSGMVFLILYHGGQASPSMPPRPLLNALRFAMTTSFGSICYGSLFTAAIRTLRWEIRGIRSKIGKNECLLCCVDLLFHLVETLVRFFNKYAYVQIVVNGKGFNQSARDAWELFQSTGIETLIAYDCSGAVLLMGAILAGLISGTCSAAWAWIRNKDALVMIGVTSALMGMILVGLAVVVVESAVTSIYVCFAEDPSLIHRWDPHFFDQLSETLHQRLQYRSARAAHVINRPSLHNIPPLHPTSSAL